ncbi:peptidoglycan endopeptidase [Amnibacterium flavum]|uniref:Peptidoglycan endopeptidase n=2 Tax=Amnibacterium flavum TaxID=2173173 RepID=A0A2V1HL27_9MICO|nr:peptidoglycan endopeptidase [Amnibacterium flavum]
MKAGIAARLTAARLNADAPRALASRGATAPRGSAPVAPRRNRGRNVLSVVVMTLAVGLVATLAIPSYAFDPAANASPEFARSDLQTLKFEEAQTVDVSADATETAVARDNYDATTVEELEAAKAAKAAEEARAAAAATYASYSGPSAADYLANPPYPNFSLQQVYEVGLQYQGVPYRYGGADPSGFDCSGFVMFVYAQFGISLAHSVRSQAASGTIISPEDAVPGDLVIFSGEGHDGIYAGNGNVLHAPYEGASVRVQPIWDSVYYVRLGI